MASLKEQTEQGFYGSPLYKRLGLPEFRSKEEIKEGLTSLAVGPVTGTLGLPSDILDLANLANDLSADYTGNVLAKAVQPKLNEIQEKYGRDAFDKGFTELTGIKSDASDVNQMVGELVSLGGLAKAGISGAKTATKAVKDVAEQTKQAFQPQAVTPEGIAMPIPKQPKGGQVSELIGGRIGIDELSKDPKYQDSIKQPEGLFGEIYRSEKGKPDAQKLSAAKALEYANIQSSHNALLENNKFDEIKQILSPDELSFIRRHIFVKNPELLKDLDAAEKITDTEMLQQNKDVVAELLQRKRYAETGVYVGRTGKTIDGSAVTQIRFEIPDVDSSLNTDKVGEILEDFDFNGYDISSGKMSEGFLSSDFDGLPEEIKKTTLGELLNHDMLYAAYGKQITARPLSFTTRREYQSIKDIPIEITPTTGRASYSRKSDTIKLNPKLLLEKPEKIKSSILHEVQHAVQSREGFESGSGVINYYTDAFAESDFTKPFFKKNYFFNEYKKLLKKGMSDSAVKTQINLVRKVATQIDTNSKKAKKLNLEKLWADSEPNGVDYMDGIDWDALVTKMVNETSFAKKTNVPKNTKKMVELAIKENFFNKVDNIAETKYYNTLGELEARTVQARDRFSTMLKNQGFSREEILNTLKKVSPLATRDLAGDIKLSRIMNNPEELDFSNIAEKKVDPVLIREGNLDITGDVEGQYSRTAPAYSSIDESRKRAENVEEQSLPDARKTLPALKAVDIKNLDATTKKLLGKISMVDKPMSATYKNIFSNETNDAIETVSEILYSDTFGGTKPYGFYKNISESRLNKIKKNIYDLTQKKLASYPDEITVYRSGNLDPTNIKKKGFDPLEEPLSFTLDPKYNPELNLPWYERMGAQPLQAYKVKKKDILASTDLRREMGEDEIIIRPKDVKLVEENVEMNKGGVPTMQKKNLESQQLELFGGMKDQGGTKDPVSGNKVPVGSTKKEVRDDIPAQLSEGEFVLPSDVVRYHGLEKIMGLRDQAKQGLGKMEAMGQMGNSDEATLPDDTPFMANTGGVAGVNIQDPAQLQKQQSVFQTTRPQGQQVQTPTVQTPTVQTPTVDTPTTSTTAPRTFKDTMGGTEFGQLPVAEQRQYKNTATGETKSFTFVNGKPVYPIPAGFVPIEEAGVEAPDVVKDVLVPTTQVTKEDKDRPSVSQVAGTGSFSLGNLNLGSLAGGAIGSIFGPIGSMIGSKIGGQLGQQEDPFAFEDRKRGGFNTKGYAGVYKTGNVGTNVGDTDVNTKGTFNNSFAVADNISDLHKYGGAMRDENGHTVYRTITEQVNSLKAAAKTGWFGGPLSPMEYHGLTSDNKMKYNNYATEAGFNEQNYGTGKGLELYNEFASDLSKYNISGTNQAPPVREGDGYLVSNGKAYKGKYVRNKTTDDMQFEKEGGGTIISSGGSGLVGDLTGSGQKTKIVNVQKDEPEPNLEAEYRKQQQAKAKADAEAETKRRAVETARLNAIAQREQDKADRDARERAQREQGIRGTALREKDINRADPFERRTGIRRAKGGLMTKPTIKNMKRGGLASR